MTTGLLDLTDSEPGGFRPEGVGVLRRGVARLLDIEPDAVAEASSRVCGRQASPKPAVPHDTRS